MAFTEAEKSKLVEICGISIYELNAQITWLGATLTSAMETDIRADITAWNAVRDKHIRIAATEKNFGADIDYNRNRTEIRRRVCLRLHLKAFGKDSGYNRILRA